MLPDKQPYIDIQYLDLGPAIVNVLQKVGGQEVPLASILSAGTGKALSQRIAVLPSSLMSGKAYLIFDTQDAPFALLGVVYAEPVVHAQSWVSLPDVYYEGTWKTAFIQGAIVAVARRGQSDWSDLTVVAPPHPNTPLRLAYLDTGYSELFVNSLGADEKWHVIAHAKTRGTNGVKYLDVTKAQDFPRRDGSYYLVLDTKGGRVPILGVQQE
jgi:hypothetical protein